MTSERMTVAAAAPSYVRAIAPYQGGRPISEIARTYGLREDEIVKLASNENPLGMSPKAHAAMLAAANDLGRYPDGSGHALKQAISRKFQVPADFITLGNGSNDILELVAGALLGPDAESVFSQHSFAVYALATQAVGAKAVVVPATKPALGHDLAAMAAAVTPATRVVWVANPNNPTGSFLSGQALRGFIEEIPSSVLMVLDEAYTEFLPEADRYDALRWVESYPNLLVSRSFSKAYGMAGLRLGFGVAQPAVTDLLNRIRQPFNVSSLAQAAGEAALFDEEFLAQTADLNARGLVQLETGLSALGVPSLPSRGNFVLARVAASPGLTRLATPGAAVGDAVFGTLLKKGVITRSVSAYGLPDWLRISVGTQVENEAFLRALGALVAEHDAG